MRSRPPDGARRRRGAGRRLEQEPLGCEVLLHVGVEVQMVLGQVREGGHREADARGAADRERVRGDLHRAGRVARLEHRTKQRLQVDRLRRGSLQRSLGTAHHAHHRPQEPGRDARRLEDVAQQERAGRLAVGSRDPGDRELGGRVAIEANRGRRHGVAGARDQRLRDAQAQRALDHECNSPGLDDLRRVIVTVGPLPHQTEEQGARARRAAVVGEAGDLGPVVALDLGLHAGQHLAELHRGRF
jgi:hypothetical protein